MLKLAFCDDEAEQRSLVGGLLQEYAAARPKLAVKVSVFSSGRELLSAAEECGGFDLYVLDVVMPELTGIQLGVQLREMGSMGPIVYLTVSPEHAMDSYAAHAFHYLIKPADAAQLFPVLDDAVAHMEKRRSACAAVKTKDGLHLARFDQILYVERVGRTVRYHMADGQLLDSVTVRKNFQEEVAPLLADPGFFQCGVSYAVNLFYVIAVERAAFQLEGGLRVPLSRGLAAQARRRWQDYWLNGPEAPKRP